MLRSLIKQTNKQSVTLSNVDKRVPVGITQCLDALNAARSKSARQGGTLKNHPMQNQILDLYS